MLWGLESIRNKAHYEESKRKQAKTPLNTKQSGKPTTRYDMPRLTRQTCPSIKRAENIWPQENIPKKNVHPSCVWNSLTNVEALGFFLAFRRPIILSAFETKLYLVAHAQRVKECVVCIITKNVPSFFSICIFTACAVFFIVDVGQWLSKLIIIFKMYSPIVFIVLILVFIYK